MAVRPVAGRVGVVLPAAHRVPVLGAPPPGWQPGLIAYLSPPISFSSWSPPPPGTAHWWPATTCSHRVVPHVPGTGLGDASSATGAGPEKDQQGCHLSLAEGVPETMVGEGQRWSSTESRGSGGSRQRDRPPPPPVSRVGPPALHVEGWRGAVRPCAEDALLPAGPRGPLLWLPGTLQTQVLLRVPQVPGGARAPL